MCPGDSARRAGWQASPGGRGLLMGAAPSERIPACGPDARARAHDPPGVRTPACEPWRAAPMRGPGVRPRCANLGVRTRFASCTHAAVALPERRMPGNLREGSYWSTSANGAGWPRVPHPCEPAYVRGRSPGKMLRRCAPEAFGRGNMPPWCVSKRSAMAIYRLDAFSSVQPWQ